MTNPGPWTPDQRRSVNPGPQQGRNPVFTNLDSVLIVVMVLSGLVFVIATIGAIADDHAGALMIAGLGLTITILCGLGRVVIHIAQTLDRIADDAREIRGIS